MSDQITIHSDGFGGRGTVLVTEEGEVLSHVRSATIELEAGEVTRVDLVIIGSNVKVTGTVRTTDFECQFCGHSEEHRCDVNLSPQ